jgi:hypothetical protein
MLGQKTSACEISLGVKRKSNMQGRLSEIRAAKEKMELRAGRSKESTARR